MQFFPDRPAALREMYRVLVPGGRLALSVFRSIHHSPAYAALADALERHVSPAAAATRRSIFALGDAEELRALIAGAGFRDIAIHPTVPVVRFPSPQEFVRRQLASWPVEEMDDNARAGLVSDVSAALQSYVDDEGLAFPMETHLAVAHT